MPALREIAAEIVRLARGHYVVGICTPVELGSPTLTLRVTSDGLTAEQTVAYATDLLDGNTTDCDPDQIAAADPARGAGGTPPVELLPAPEADDEEAGPRPPGSRFRDCGECPQMVVVPAGNYLMGSPEWEYVARAGTTTPFHTGETISGVLANYNAELTYGAGVRGSYRRRTVPAGSFPANDFGLHDVHGNVWEWVEDCWHGSYDGAPSDGSARGSARCIRRVVRGGAWFYDPRLLRSAYRSWNFAANQSSEFGGFRVARTLHP